MSEPHDTIEPEGGGRPEQIADEQFVHGLLEFLRRDDAVEQDRRIERVLSAIGGADRASPEPIVHRVPWAVVATLAAAVLGVVLVVGLSGGQSAADLVEEAVAVADRSGDRRYEVQAFLHGPSAGAVFTAALDVRDADHCVLRAKVHGTRVILGRNSGFAWSIDPHGETHRLDPMQNGHWLVLDHVAVMLESVDTMLAHLGHGYVLERPGDETLDGQGETRFERVSARQGRPLGSTPHHIELPGCEEV